MPFPRLTIDLQRIAANARRMVEAARPGVSVMGVTKGVLGDVEIARVLVEAGVDSIGDARLGNIERIRRAALGVPLWLLRSPGPSEVHDAVSLCDGSLQADRAVLRLMGAEAQRQARRHRVLLMVDLDTGREGFAADEVLPLYREVAASPWLEPAGLGIYFDFRSDDSFLRQKTTDFAALVDSLASTGLDLPLRSGGASNVFHSLLLAGTLPPAINHLRMGTAPLLGISTSHGPRVVEGWDRDTFLLEAEVNEVKRDRAEALLALGHLEAPPEYLYPVEPGIVIRRASSDHTVIGFNEESRLSAGDVVRFRLGYYAMNRLMLSPYTRVVYR